MDTHSPAGSNGWPDDRITREAWRLIVAGGEEFVAADLNEDGEYTNIEHNQIIERAEAMLKGLRAAHIERAATPPAETPYSRDATFDHIDTGYGFPGPQTLEEATSLPTPPHTRVFIAADPDTLHHSIRMAIADPGAFLPRERHHDGGYESIQNWGARAVVALLSMAPNCVAPV